MLTKPRVRFLARTFAALRFAPVRYTVPDGNRPLPPVAYKRRAPSPVPITVYSYARTGWPLRLPR